MRLIESPPTFRHFAVFPYVVFIFLLLLGTLVSAYGQWTKHIIDPNTIYTVMADASDIDNDGDMDLFVADEVAGKILFYENNNNSSWIRHIMDGSGGEPSGVKLADIDNDGKLDLIASHYMADLVSWYRNDGGTPTQWIKHTIDNSHDGPIANTSIADINGDGALDVVLHCWHSGKLIWFENNLPTDWTSHVIGSDMPHYTGIAVADFNDDNKPDVIHAVADQHKVILFENNLPDNNWSEIIIDDKLPGAFTAKTADIDNDGDPDLVVASMKGGEPALAWYENDGTGQAWTKHAFISDYSNARCVWLGDLDANGYVDIAVTEENGNAVTLQLNEDGGQNWTEVVVDDNHGAPNGVFTFDIDLDGDLDLLVTRRTPGALVWYENPLGSAYATSLEASPFLIQSLTDTLLITTVLSNPDNHPASVLAIIEGDQSDFVDSLQLFDDGLHSDGDSSDNVWSNTIIVTGLPEDEYEVDLFTYDSTYGDTMGFIIPARFITIGPVALEEHTFYADIVNDDTIPSPGDWLQLKLTVKNNSSMAIATNIAADLISLDTLISFYFDYNKCSFQDIPAGESLGSDDVCWIKISEECPVGKEIPIEVNISSYGNVCWRDTFSISVQATGLIIDDVRTRKTRIFPNPTNNQLTIETEKSDRYSIEISSLNGQLVYSTEMDGNSKQLDISTFQKGVYFITIRSKDFVTTRKIIKL